MHHPDHFPITWRHPTDANLFWSQDRLHFPEPVTPLEFSFIEGAVDAGISKAARQYDIPITVLDRHINGYVYFCVQPDELSVDAAAALAKQAEAKLWSAMDNLLTLWQTHWLPEIQGYLAFWEQYPLSTATLPELLQHLNDTEEHIKRVWEVHFLLFLPSMVAISRFADLYTDLLQPTDPHAAYQLLTGFETKTIQSAEALWALSRQLLTSPILYDTFRQNPADQVLRLLAERPAAAAFLADLQHYLRVHGYRADKLSLSQPYWVEDATPVIKSLQAYIQQPAGDWPDRQPMAAQRQQAVRIELSIPHFFANTLPENKALLVEQLQQAGHAVCFIGDGINDAIALKKANVSISLRGASSAATDSAQIILMQQSLQQVPYLFDLAQRFDANMKAGFATAIGQGAITITGALLGQIGILAGTLIWQTGLLAGLGIATLPMLQNGNDLTPHANHSILHKANS